MAYTDCLKKKTLQEQFFLNTVQKKINPFTALTLGSKIQMAVYCFTDLYITDSFF